MTAGKTTAQVFGLFGLLATPLAARCRNCRRGSFIHSPQRRDANARAGLHVEWSGFDTSHWQLL